MSNSRSSVSVGLSSSIVAASVIGLVIGLIEGLSGVLFGHGLTSAWVASSFRLPAITKALYALFVVSFFTIGFQAVVIVAGLMSSLRTSWNLKPVVPPWVLVILVGAVTAFAAANNDLFFQIQFWNIITFTILYVCFFGICIWQVRAFFRKAPLENEPDNLDFLVLHWARAASYLLLVCAMLLIPQAQSYPASLLGRAAVLAAILLLVAPISALWKPILRPVMIRARRAEGRRYAPHLLAIILVAAPLCFTLYFGNRSLEEDLFARRPERAPVEARPNSPNVIIMLVDMLRADHVGWYGYQHPTTPRLDALAEGGVAFRNAYSESSWTLPSTVSLLTGVYPTVHGARIALCSLADEVETMAEIFRRNGYVTGAFVTNPHLKRSFNVDQGFDFYYDDFVSYSYLRAAGNNIPLFANVRAGLEILKLAFSRSDYNFFNTADAGDQDMVYWSERMDLAKVNAGALKWVRKNQDRPFFLYLHYLDVHGPYVRPRPFFDNVSANERKTEINLYDGAIRYTDGEIGNFIDELRRLQTLSNSIVLVTADHGQEFYEHGRIGHGLSLFEEQLHIPLIFLHTDAFPFRGAFSEVVGLTDVLPTLVDYLDLEGQRGAVDGKSLVPLLTDGKLPEASDYRYAETERYNLHRSIRYSNRWKYIYMEKSPVGQQLFDLENDPLERKNILDKNPALAKDLRNKLDQKYAEFQSRAAATQITAADEQTQQLLKSLGYLN